MRLENHVPCLGYFGNCVKGVGYFGLYALYLPMILFLKVWWVWCLALSTCHNLSSPGERISVDCQHRLACMGSSWLPGLMGRTHLMCGWHLLEAAQRKGHRVGKLCSFTLAVEFIYSVAGTAEPFTDMGMSCFWLSLWTEDEQSPRHLLSLWSQIGSDKAVSPVDWAAPEFSVSLVWDSHHWTTPTLLSKSIKFYFNICILPILFL